MRKKLMTMLLLTTMVMTTLAGCGDKKKDAANEGTDATAEVAESTVGEAKTGAFNYDRQFSLLNAGDLSAFTDPENSFIIVPASDHDIEWSKQITDGDIGVDFSTGEPTLVDANKATEWLDGFDELFLGIITSETGDWVGVYADPDYRDEATKLMVDEDCGAKKVTYREAEEKQWLNSFELDFLNNTTSDEMRETRLNDQYLFGRPFVECEYYEKDGKYYVTKIVVTDKTADNSANETTGDAIVSGPDETVYTLTEKCSVLLENSPIWSDLQKANGNALAYNTLYNDLSWGPYKNQLWYIEKDGMYYVFNMCGVLDSYSDNDYNLDANAMYTNTGQTFEKLYSMGWVISYIDENAEQKVVSESEMAAVVTELTGETDMNKVVGVGF